MLKKLVKLFPIFSLVLFLVWLGGFIFSLARPCQVFPVSANDLEWVGHYQNKQKVTFKNKQGKTQTFETIIERQIGNLRCDKLNLSYEQHEYLSVELKKVDPPVDLLCNFSVSISSDEKQVDSKRMPFFHLCGMEFPSEKYGAKLIREDITVDGKTYTKTLKFTADGNAAFFGREDIKAAWWDKVFGLIQFETAAGGLYRLTQSKN